VLRELKTHLSWFGTSTSNNLTISIRYFYIPRTQYGQSRTGDISSNIIIGSTDPLQLEPKPNNDLMNNLVFYEWQITDTNTIIFPPAAACVLIIASVISLKRIKQKRKQHNQNRNKDNELSDSDTDNGFIVPEDEENTNSEEGKY
jgi:hypothetical protein